MPVRSKKVLNSARHIVVGATDDTEDIFRTRAQNPDRSRPAPAFTREGDFQNQRAEGTPSPAASPAISASIVGPARIDRLWQSTPAWARMSILNLANMARFSSGRTITE
jgi:Carbohydrate phosphorylase